ncbi:MAG TPA: VOC family protein [Bryobacteraceae bacterium]|nr:VOC family protein [Bryobacteraceae bacterium]
MAPQRSALLSITPLIPAGANLAEAVKFYKDRLGFKVLWEGMGMAAIARDSISFNLVKNENREWAENASFSIGVTNLDALYEEYRDIQDARVGPLETKAWGRREFHMIVPFGVCLQFYQQVR